MAENGREFGSRWRAAAWGAAGLLLLLPAVAMRFTDEVNWTLSDFVFFGALLLSVAGAFELAVRMTPNPAYRAAAGIALLAAFLLVWMNAAVGIIGSENNPANLMFGGVLAVGILGAVIARAQPQGMARAAMATAFVQALVAVIALITGLGDALTLVGLTGFFVTLWLLSASLFGQAARAESRANGPPRP